MNKSPVDKANWDDEEHRLWENRERGQAVQARLAQRRFMRSCLLVVLCACLVLVVLASLTAIRDMRLDKQYLNPGLANYRSGNWQAAQRDLSAYLQLTGRDNAYISYVLGMCYYNEGNDQEALKYFWQDRYVVTRRRRAFNPSQVYFLPNGLYIRQRSAIMIERITGKQSLN